MSDVKRIYVEKRVEYATEANEIKHNLIEQLGLEIDTSRSSFCNRIFTWSI